MPVARTPPDIFLLALYTIVGGRILQGRLVTTIADRLGIPFERASQMAEAAASAGLVNYHNGSSVSLTADGQERGATLTPPRQPSRTRTKPGIKPWAPKNC